MDSPARRELAHAILRSVSRSFYLSIRLLPRALREPIGLAYLLARATDTIADTAGVDGETRAENLRALSAAIQGDGSLPTLSGLQTDPAESRLLAALPQCLEWLSAIAEDDRHDIRRVLEKITRGQTLDLLRFQEPSRLTSLQSADELHEYTYLVAGCVGEFWTAVCFRHVPNFANRSQTEMQEWGRAYGQGLQLINILRDAGGDRRAGRCYLPGDAPMEARLAEWIPVAQRGLEAGLEYACAIRSRRVRLATVLPSVIGARTLGLLREAPAGALEKRIKVPRAEVRRTMVTLVRRLVSINAIRDEFARAAQRK